MECSTVTATLSVNSKATSNLHMCNVVYSLQCLGNAKGDPSLGSPALCLLAAAVSEREANEQGSFLIGKRSHCGGLKHVFAKRKELW